MLPNTSQILRRWKRMAEATMAGIGGTGGGSQPGITNATFPMPFAVLRRAVPNKIVFPSLNSTKKRRRLKETFAGEQGAGAGRPRAANDTAKDPFARGRSSAPGSKNYPQTPAGDLVRTVRQLRKKYGA